MNANKRTPGPWQAERNGSRPEKLYSVVADVEDGRKVLLVYVPATEANARLIACAPEMFKTLLGIVHHNDAVKPNYKLPDSLVREINQILKKAGE